MLLRNGRLWLRNGRVLLNKIRADLTGHRVKLKKDRHENSRRRRALDEHEVSYIPSAFVFPIRAWWPVAMTKAPLMAALIGFPACSSTVVPGSSSALVPPLASTKGTESTPTAVSSPVRSDEPAPPSAASSSPLSNKSPPRNLVRPGLPLEFAVGDKRVVVRFTERLHPIIAQKVEFRFVESIVVDNEAAVFPPQCDAPTPSATGLCSQSHIQLRSVLGKGKDLQLLGTHARGKRLDLLFAAVFAGSPECGAYGYWLLRVGPTGVRATSPIVGCWSTPDPEGPDREYLNPMIRWDSPVSIRLDIPAAGWRRFDLNSQTFEWTQVARGGCEGRSCELGAY